MIDDCNIKKFMVRSMIKMWASKFNIQYQLDVVDNGYLGFKKVEETVNTDGNSYDLVIMDFNFPTPNEIDAKDMSDGILTAKAIRNLWKSEKPASIILQYLIPEASNTEILQARIMHAENGVILRNIFKTSFEPNYAPKIIGYSTSFTDLTENSNTSDKKQEAELDMSCLDAVFKMPLKFDELQEKMNKYLTKAQL